MTVENGGGLVLLGGLVGTRLFPTEFDGSRPAVSPTGRILLHQARRQEEASMDTKTAAPAGFACQRLRHVLADAPA